jgi:hypothetical protein
MYYYCPSEVPLFTEVPEKEVVVLSRLLSHIVLLVFAVGFMLGTPFHLQSMEGGSTKASGVTGHFCTGAIQSPIKVELEVSNIQDIDGESGTAEFILTLTPLTESVRVSWEVTAPAQLSPIAGSWEGIEPIEMGEELTRTLSFSISDGDRHYLYARAILETERGELYTGAVSRYVDLGAPDIGNPPFVRRDAVRGDVTSFRGVELEGGDR